MMPDKEEGFREGGFVTGETPLLRLDASLLEINLKELDRLNERLREVQGPPIVGKLSRTINIIMETSRCSPKDSERFKADLQGLIKSMGADHVEAKVVEPLALPAPESDDGQ